MQPNFQYLSHLHPSSFLSFSSLLFFFLFFSFSFLSFSFLLFPFLFFSFLFFSPFFLSFFLSCIFSSSCIFPHLAELQNKAGSKPFCETSARFRFCQNSGRYRRIHLDNYKPLRHFSRCENETLFTEFALVEHRYYLLFCAIFHNTCCRHE